MRQASETGGQQSSESAEIANQKTGNRQEFQFREKALIAAYGAFVRARLPFTTVQLLRMARDQEGASNWFKARRGIQKTERPQGSVIWLHTEENSEVTSTIALARRLAEACPDSKFLITTPEMPGFDVDAEDPQQDDQPGIIQKIAPHLQPGWINRFLDHWRPDGAIFVSTMPNPNYVIAARKRDIPLLMVNGTISMKAYRRWRYFPWLIGPALREFSVVLAPTRSEGARLRRLGARNVIVSGGLKYDGKLPTPDQKPNEPLRDSLSRRTVWLAACSTIYETLTAIEVHKALRQEHSDLLSIVVPSGMTSAEFRSVAGASDLIVTSEAETCAVDEKTDIYLPSAESKLSTLYPMADVAFLGGTEPHQDGADPIVAASLGAVVLHGPNMHRYQKAVSDLQAAGASQTVRDAVDLSRTLNRLLATPDLIQQKSIAGKRVAKEETEVVDHIMALIGREIRKFG